MPRKYTHVQLLEGEFIRLREDGYTRREIADMFGLDEIQVKTRFIVTKGEWKPFLLRQEDVGVAGRTL